MLLVLLVSLVYCVNFVKSDIETVCDVRARTDTGWVCGLRRIADHGVVYASFRGIPYAQQPLGEWRFKELRPAKPWPHHLNATVEGPRCPQHDEFYGRLVTLGRGMSESCIYANVHVPLKTLPNEGSMDDESSLPVLVYVHGGGFQSGAGDADMYGPEYLVAKGIVVITFNYRINVFGFLSLNTTSIPGNAGLRDIITLLRWVRRNAGAFGGDPDDVTIGGHSSGAAMAHLVALSNESKGLMKRLILMSGTAFPSFFTTSPVYAAYVATLFFRALGLNSTDPEDIHSRLLNMPIERIMNANTIVQYETGIVSFFPVVESKHPGVSRILESDPITLLQEGRGNYPKLIGTVNAECESLKWRLEYLDILGRITNNPLVVLSPRLAFAVPLDVGQNLGRKMIERYFHSKLTMEEYLGLCLDTLFSYAAFKVGQLSAAIGGEPVFLYLFSYESENNVVKDSLYLKYKQVAHIEDLTMVFRPNAMLDSENYPPSARDDFMKEWMVNFVINFMRCSDPTCGTPDAWPPVQAKLFNRQDIRDPGVYFNMLPTRDERDMIRFHDGLEEIASNSTIIGAREDEYDVIIGFRT